MSFADRLRGYRLVVAALIAASLYGCGGGGGGDATSADSVSVDAILSGAAKLATDDPSAAFSELPAGVSPVTVNSPPILNFTVKTTEGKLVTGLTTDHLRFAFAKLIPGTEGNPNVEGSGESAEWVSYIYRERTSDLFPDGVWQATAENTGDLTYNAAGYYTYTFFTDVTTATLPDTDSLIWDPDATHRVAVQLQLRDANRTTVAVMNPYYDFTLGSDGRSVPVSDDETHVVVDRSSCNECHTSLAMHGGGRIDPQYCVMCHNPGTTDADTGNVLDFKVMIHKIHAGRYLTSGYEIGDLSYADVGFPQDLRNCSKCHDGSDLDAGGELLTPQGDNWQTKPTQQACGACHDYVDFNDHQGLDLIADDGTPDNSLCERCHVRGGSGSSSNEDTVVNAHWNQLEENAKNYQFNIEDVVYNSQNRQVTVTYSVTNPNDGSAYDLTEDCPEVNNCANRFSELKLAVASLSLIGAPNSIADYTHVVSEQAIKGTDDGAHHYTLTLPPLPSSAVAEAHGTARVVSIGQIMEAEIDNPSSGSGSGSGNTGSGDTLNVPLLNSYREFALDGTLQARRKVVSNAKCNACHGLLGTPSVSYVLSDDSLVEAFHAGGNNSVESCPICHNALRASNTLMNEEAEGETRDVDPTFADTGLFPGDRIMNQVYDFKTLIHGIHGGEQRASHYTQGNPPAVVKDYSERVFYPGILSNCTVCHEGDSYRIDQGVLGSSVLSSDTSEANPNADLLTLVTVDGTLESAVDPLQLPVISPKAASCAGCHDTAEERAHMRDIGGAAFDLNQAAVALDGKVFERCNECHGISGGVDIKSVHHIE